MNSLHERLKEERIRLGLTQADFAGKGGVLRRAQVHYESGERCPDGHYFAKIAAAGADVHYILTGNKSKINYQAMKIAELMDALNEKQRKEIFTAIEKEKRLNELEARFNNQMQAVA